MPCANRKPPERAGPLLAGTCAAVVVLADAHELAEFLRGVRWVAGLALLLAPLLLLLP